MKVIDSDDIHIGDRISFDWRQHYGFSINSIEMIKPTLERYTGVVMKELPYNHEIGIPHWEVKLDDGRILDVGLNCGIYKINID